MKKLLLSLSLLLTLVAHSFAADGVLNFANFGSDSVGGGHSLNAPIFDTNGSTLLAGSGFSVQLFYGAVGASDGQLVALGSPINFLTGGFSGYFSGGTVSIPGFAVGTQIQIQIRAWNNASGTITSYDAATIKGASTSFVSQALGDSLTPSTIPVMNGLTSFQLSTAAVPEPTTIALGVIGGLGLLARRRRNA